MKKRIIAAALALSFGAMFALAGCGDGTQTITLEDGSTYVGQATDGVPDGTGTLTDFLGSQWTGTFVEGKISGYGTYTGYDFTEYDGFFENGLFSGMGHMSAANGDEYWGMFENGKKNGVGRMEYTTACVYEGGWVDDFMQGMGWMTWPVGDMYFGQWELGNPQGVGCKLFYDAAFSVKDDLYTYNMYVGGMKNNLMNGWGIMYFAETGGIYAGDWEDGIRNDEHGVYYFESGIEFVKFEGAFSKDKNSGWIWGEGTMWYADGRVVTGVWENTDCVQIYEEGNTDPSDPAGEAETAKADFFANELVQGAMSING